jgi:O-antigen ligase
MRGGQFATFVVVWAASLFIEKVRFITGYSIALLTLLLFNRVNPKRLAILALPLAFALSVALAGFAAYGTGAIDPVLNTAFAYATVDQGSDNITGLSGRSDLWDLLQTYIAARPELGYGFGAFWNPDHLQQVASALNWAPVVAHNGYLDETLATGLIGVTLNVAFWLAALGVALWRAVHDRDEFAWLAAACISLYLLLNWGDSIMQFYFRYPFYASLVALFAMLGSARNGLSRVASSAAQQSGLRSPAAK